jgi:hypothetical protein
MVGDAAALDQLGEDTGTGAGVDEGNQPVVQAAPRLRVDEFDSVVSEGFQCRGEIVDKVGDVVDALPTRGKEAPDWRSAAISTFCSAIRVISPPVKPRVRYWATAAAMSFTTMPR